MSASSRCSHSDAAAASVLRTYVSLVLSAVSASITCALWAPYLVVSYEQMAGNFGLIVPRDSPFDDAEANDNADRLDDTAIFLLRCRYHAESINSLEDRQLRNLCTPEPNQVSYLEIYHTFIASDSNHAVGRLHMYP